MEIIAMMFLQTKMIPSNEEPKFWKRHLTPLGLTPKIERQKNIDDGSMFDLLSIQIRWRANDFSYS